MSSRHLAYIVSILLYQTSSPVIRICCFNYSICSKFTGSTTLFDLGFSRSWRFFHSLSHVSYFVQNPHPTSRSRSRSIFIFLPSIPPPSAEDMQPQHCSNDESDEYVSDDRGEEIPSQRSLSEDSGDFPEAMDQPAVQSTSSSEHPDNYHKIARQSAEEATMRKTGWLLLRTTGHNLSIVTEKAGANGLHVVQLYNKCIPSNVRPRAFLLLYKWSPDRGERIPWNAQYTRNPDIQVDGSEDPEVATHSRGDSSHVVEQDVIFCEQTMDNASATQALVLALLNIPEHGGSNTDDNHGRGDTSSTNSSLYHNYDIGDRLRVLKTFLKPLDPTLRAAAVSSSDVIRQAHNSAAREQSFLPDLLDEDGKVRTALLAEELWMFSVFVPMRGNTAVYELEGMADGAHLLAQCSEMEWVDVVTDAVTKRISMFRQHNIPFLLFALSEGQRSPAHGATHDPPDAVKQTEFCLSDEERIVAMHGYEKFFIEMLKLMASRGDIGNLIRKQDPSRNSHGL